MGRLNDRRIMTSNDCKKCGAKMVSSKTTYGMLLECPTCDWATLVTDGDKAIGPVATHVAIKPKTQMTYALGDGFADVKFDIVPKCRHWRQKVAVGQYSVTASSYLSGNGLDPIPQFGVYLSSLWQSKLGKVWANYGRIRGHVAYPAIIVDWKDMDTIDMKTLKWIMQICMGKMIAGKVIDIGCQGGHGRTGTLIACLIGKVEGISAEKAIEEVRSRYCKSAIETKSQEKLIAEYLKEG